MSKLKIIYLCFNFLVASMVMTWIVNQVYPAQDHSYKVCLVEDGTTSKDNKVLSTSRQIAFDHPNNTKVRPTVASPKLISCVIKRRNLRYDWAKILGPCLNLTKWNRTDQSLKKRYWTSANRSLVAYKDQYNVGECINIKIYSATEHGRLKTLGGDSWRALLTGRSTEALDVLDNNDGTYDITFNLYDEGSYQLELTLEYSMCNGLKDPPDDWFIKGNVHGRFQQEGSLGHLDDCKNEVKKHLSFDVISAKSNQEYIQQDQQDIETQMKECQFVWDGFGRWKDGYWRPFRQKDDIDSNTFAKLNRTARLNTLWIYGDSLAKRLFDSVMERPLCMKIFVNCTLTYTWVYPLSFPIANETYDRYQWDNNDFNETKFLLPISKVLDELRMKDNKSMLLINFGLHLVVTISFERYKLLLESFIAMMQHRKKLQGSMFPRLIWKTITMHNKEGSPNNNVTEKRFLTLQRVQLYNAYTIAQMCKYGIEVLDVYPISAARKAYMIDSVHFERDVFWPAEDMLLYNILQHYNVSS